MIKSDNKGCLDGWNQVSGHMVKGKGENMVNSDIGEVGCGFTFHYLHVVDPKIVEKCQDDLRARPCINSFKDMNDGSLMMERLDSTLVSDTF